MVRENIQYEVRQSCLIMYVSEALDHHRVMTLKAQTDRLIDTGNVRHVIFDFRGVDFMDSSGIGLIMGRYKRVSFLGGRTAVCQVGPEVERILSLSGLFQIIKRYDTVEEAVEGCLGLAGGRKG